MDSSSGNVTLTPVDRNRVRRLSGVCIMLSGVLGGVYALLLLRAGLLMLEHSALNNFVNDVAHGKIVLARSVENRFQFFTIGKLKLTAG